MKCSKAVKRVLCLLLMASVLFVSAMPALAAKKPNGAYIVTTVEGDRLIVHPSPSIVGEVTRLEVGTVVVYKSQKKGWWKVAFYGGSGYVDPQYLVSVASAPSAKYKPVKKIPVYAKNRTSSRKLGTLKPSQKVRITKKKDGWVRIKLGSHTGWVQAKYLRKVG